jgi:pimeloyl-ACP methyl ester carboxylesterase
MARPFAAFLSAGLMMAGSAAAAELSFSVVPGHGGLPLSVAETGNPEGPEILLLHGMAMGLQSFQPQFGSALAKEFRIVAYDLRGHGNSGKPWRAEDVLDPAIWADDVAAVIAAKGLKKPVIVGWSYGGFVAADYIRKYGTGGLSGLNLVASIAGLVPQPPPVGNIPPEEMKRRAAMQTSGNLLDNLTVVEATVKLFEFPGITTEYRDQMVALGAMVPAYFRRALVGRNLDHQDVTAKLDLPILITMGGNDLTQGREPFDRLVAALPKAKVSVYEGVGHLPFAQDSKRFNSELAEFVRSVDR